MGGEGKSGKSKKGRLDRNCDRQARTLPQVQLSQGCRMRGTGEKMDSDVGQQSTGGAEGARDQSYPLTIGIEGATDRRPKL